MHGIPGTEIKCLWKKRKDHKSNYSKVSERWRTNERANTHAGSEGSLWITISIVHHRTLKAQFVSDDTIRYRERDKTENILLPWTTRVLAVRCGWTNAPSVHRDTIVLSATRYTTYDWHARSVTTYMYTILSLSLSVSLLPNRSLWSFLPRVFSLVERILRGHAKANWSKASSNVF